MSLLALAFRAIITLAFLVLALRLAGKRGIGGIGALELLLAFLLGNLGAATLLGQMSVLESIITAGALIWIHLLVNTFARLFPQWHAWVFGTPCLIIRSGKILQGTVVREAIDADEIARLVRLAGVARLTDVLESRIENDGEFSFARTDNARRLTREDVRAAPAVDTEEEGPCSRAA